MTPIQAIRHWTNQATLAKVLGVTPQVVNNWKKRGRIPLAQQIELHELSLGALKLDGIRSGIYRRGSTGSLAEK